VFTEGRERDEDTSTGPPNRRTDAGNGDQFTERERTDERTPATKQGGSRDTPRAVPGQLGAHDQAAREGGREQIAVAGGGWWRAYRI